MSNYKDQVELVKTLTVKEGDRKKMDCPFCGGKDKFTIDKYDGKLVWNCFRASCNVKGSYAGQRNISAAKSYLAGSAIQRHKAQYKDVPTLTTRISTHQPAIDYLKSVNSFDAFERGDIKVRYAPKEHRVLFYNHTQLGAVGRSLRPVRSKWWSYGDLSEGIHVGQGNHGVLVEDVASACAVSNVPGLVGVALLGTNITKSIKTTLNKYTKLTLVLDNDASSKAISMAGNIGMNCLVRLTQHDLKYLSAVEIRNGVLQNGWDYTFTQKGRG